MNLDGSGQAKGFNLPIPSPAVAVSPDGKWFAHQSKDHSVVVDPLGGGDRVAVCTGCTPSWTPDGASLLLFFKPLMGGNEMAAIIPLKAGHLPRFPPEGLRGIEDAASLPGVVVFPSAEPGAAAGSTYAYVRLSSQGNIFRITLPN